MIDFKGKTFLIVDDEEFIREILCDFMQMYGAVTLTAANGNEAIQMLKDHKDAIDIVLSDVRMPQGDGIALARWIKETGSSFTSCKKAPLVFFSSGFSDVGEDLKVELNIITIFPKPHDLDKMVEYIQSKI